ncbi:phosphatase IMPL1, chloroplastic [Rosa chinensis]|uniref:phosphatase IMPL1, chloroplastic n=1 Tax=Rosa chinensis TaxID=74649 RepID=UPI000D0919DB|nr:phosphatase IMPL1, chloroplastic [Rosa chinensis]
MRYFLVPFYLKSNYVQVEFVGGPVCWNTRIFSASAGSPSSIFQVERSLLDSGFDYEHDDPGATNIEPFKEFTDVSRGVRMLGAAAVDMCHVALGIVEAYWEYRLKPWEWLLSEQIVEEAGGVVTCMDGAKFCVFDRSVLVSNGVLHAKVNLSAAVISIIQEKKIVEMQLLERIAPATENLKSKQINLSLWYKPENCRTEL